MKISLLELITDFYYVRFKKMHKHKFCETGEEGVSLPPYRYYTWKTFQCQNCEQRIDVYNKKRVSSKEKYNSTPCVKYL